MLSLLDNNSSCSIYLNSIRTSYLATSPLLIRKLSPNDNYWLDKVKYRCEFCDDEFEFEQPNLHPAQCTSRKNLRHQLPPYVGPRYRELLEVISNPMLWSTNSDPSISLIHHLDGRQLVSKFTPRNKTISFMKAQLSEISGIDRRLIKVYKF